MLLLRKSGSRNSSLSAGRSLPLAVLMLGWFVRRGGTMTARGIRTASGSERPADRSKAEFQSPGPTKSCCPQRPLNCARRVTGSTRGPDLQPGRNEFGRLPGCQDRMDLEFDEVAPRGHPIIEKAAVIRFHYLKTGRKPLIHPARNVVQSVGSQSPEIAKPPIHGQGILVAKTLDYHVEHSDFLRCSDSPAVDNNAAVRGDRRSRERSHQKLRRVQSQ